MDGFPKEWGVIPTKGLPELPPAQIGLANGAADAPDAWLAAWLYGGQK